MNSSLSNTFEFYRPFKTTTHAPAHDQGSESKVPGQMLIFRKIGNNVVECGLMLRTAPWTDLLFVGVVDILHEKSFLVGKSTLELYLPRFKAFDHDLKVDNIQYKVNRLFKPEVE